MSHKNRLSIFCRLVFISLGIAIGLQSASISVAQEEQDDSFFRGLISRVNDAAQKTVLRVDQSLSLHWKQTPDLRLTKAPFRVESAGLIEILARGEYRFAVYAAGTSKVTMDKQSIISATTKKLEWAVSEPIDLSFGFHEISVDYQTLDRQGDFALFWQGPNFSWEPMPSSSLFHETESEEIGYFELGKQLTVALRCAACHQHPFQQPAIPAPDLKQIAGNIQPQWVIAHLQQNPEKSADERAATDTTAMQVDMQKQRRMPFYRLERAQARAITAYLLRATVDAKSPKKETSDNAHESTNEQINQQQESGRELFLTIGCIACHSLGELGSPSWFDGGDLSNIAKKRPREFFAKWLAQPSQINQHHRMPVFELDDLQREQLAIFLSSLTSQDSRNALETDESTAQIELQIDQAEIAKGEKLFQQFRCANCHEKTESSLTITAEANWQKSCLAATERQVQPRYVLNKSDRAAIEYYYQQLPADNKNSKQHSPEIDPAMLIAQNNCLNCHARDNSAGLSLRLASITAAVPQLASEFSALQPPSLTSVGDKLSLKFLRTTILKPDNGYRHWLRVQMPRFAIDETSAHNIATYFIQQDLIPELPAKIAPSKSRKLDPVAMKLGAPVLLTSAGLSCTSCHQVGDSIPANAPINARGPSLSMINERMRQEWFERWLRNPARIVPGMEMPSVQVPVSGLLDNDLDLQFEAIWQLINQRGFTPPSPDPIRVLEFTDASDLHQRAFTLNDVVADYQQVWINPLVVGLPNQNNILFDLQTGTLAAWWPGVMVAQQNRGKIWYWQTGNTSLFPAESPSADLQLLDDAYHPVAIPGGQFVANLRSWSSQAGGATFSFDLSFAEKQSDSAKLDRSKSTLTAIVVEQISAIAANQAAFAGWKRHTEISGVPANASVALRMFPESLLKQISGERSDGAISIGLPNYQIEIQPNLKSPHAEVAENQLIIRADQHGRATFDVAYLMQSLQSTDETDAASENNNLPGKSEPAKIAQLTGVPGFVTTRLPIDRKIMPTGISQRPDGKLLVSSLTGQVWLVEDTNRDGFEDRAAPVSDELSSPYGLFATDAYVDVITKHALVRLTDSDQDGFYESNQVIASGWGHTDDYHDWAVGLPRLADGSYLVGLPCQQDDRSAAAAHLRGRMLRLTPAKDQNAKSELYQVQEISAGHRFPMGIAVNRREQIFVTDNQGNYNPFNELNYVQPGKHFGFINKLERSDKQIATDLTAPAIDIPHPWTRSVNGICFLETDDPSADERLFGPFAGHLIGCEYDTRRLIRMSLEQVGQDLQGAAYPLSDPQSIEKTDAGSDSQMLGPIVCTTLNDGSLIVGSVRDSGWGAGNNVGELIRLSMRPETLPCGIAEIRLLSDGFSIDFTRSVEADKAKAIANYLISSYTRTSTPQYGGEDQQRRNEKIREIRLSADRKQATVHLGEIRAGFVYEFRLKPLVDQPFFPDEAFYTVRSLK
jgi:mono/diheme cytochrome c family protein